MKQFVAIAAVLMVLTAGMTFVSAASRPAQCGAGNCPNQTTCSQNQTCPSKESCSTPGACEKTCANRANCTQTTKGTCGMQRGGQGCART